MKKKIPIIISPIALFLIFWMWDFFASYSRINVGVLLGIISAVYCLYCAIQIFLGVKLIHDNLTLKEVLVPVLISVCIIVIMVCVKYTREILFWPAYAVSTQLATALGIIYLLLPTTFFVITFIVLKRKKKKSEMINKSN